MRKTKPITKPAPAAEAPVKPAERRARFRRLAEALAIVLQHPATPKNSARILGQIVRIVAHYAGIAPAAIAKPRPDVARMEARAAFLEFGLAVAEAVDDDGLDAKAFEEITECSNEIEDLLKPENVREAQAARLRGIMNEYWVVGTVVQPAPLRVALPGQGAIEPLASVYQRVAETVSDLLRHPHASSEVQIMFLGPVSGDAEESGGRRLGDQC